MTEERDLLREMILSDAVQYGDFTLAGGAKSNFYLDVRKVTLNARGLEMITDEIIAREGVIDPSGRGWDGSPTVVAGPSIGADPIVAGLILHAWSGYGIRWHGALIRSTAKEYGTGKLVEGPLIKPGTYVTLVEDVTTSGGSLVRAAEVMRSIGCVVKHAFVVVDREAGAKEALEAVGIKLHALYTLTELGLK